MKETIAGAAARKALPWVVGGLALAGLVMVGVGLWARRRPLPNQIALSITRLQVSEGGRSSGHPPARAKLALSLVRTEMPTLEASFGDHQEEPNARRAA